MLLKESETCQMMTDLSIKKCIRWNGECDEETTEIYK